MVEDGQLPGIVVKGDGQEGKVMLGATASTNLSFDLIHSPCMTFGSAVPCRFSSPVVTQPQQRHNHSSSSNDDDDDDDDDDDELSMVTLSTYWPRKRRNRASERASKQTNQQTDR